MAKKTKSIGDTLTPIAVKQCEAAVKFKAPRLADIAKSEKLYINRPKPPLRGHINIPLPILSGFVDTLKSKLDDPVRVQYNHTSLADLRKARKVTAAWNFESGPTQQKWNKIDRLVKTMAIFSGVGIYKYTADSVGGSYKGRLEPVDYNDFFCEPGGGIDLSTHLFKGQMNIARTKWQLEQGADAGFYNAAQVRKLLNRHNNDQYKTNSELFQHKINRYSALGFDYFANAYTGQEVINLTEQVLTYNGKSYYLLYHYDTGIWIRCEETSQVFDNDLEPWRAWHTHEDHSNFWNKAPADDIRPVAEAMQILFNQALENRQKRNFGQRAYDPSVFPDPSQLEYRPSGLVKATPTPGKSISSGLYHFETPDISGGTVDLISFMDNFLGQKTGITAGAQGVSDQDTKVGVYYGDLQQVADRLGLYNKSYTECQAELGELYWRGLQNNMTEAFMVKMIGREGIGWEEITQDDTNPDQDFDITVTGGNAEVEADGIKRKERSEAIKDIASDPAMRAEVNPRWLVEQRLRLAYSEEETKTAMDKISYGNEEELADAESAFEELVTGGEPELNRYATEAYVEKIIDLAYDNMDLDTKVFDKILEYANEHLEIVQKNVARRAVQVLANGGVSPDQIQGPMDQAMDPNTATPGTNAGTQSMSQEMTAQVTPAMPQAPGGAV